MRNILEIERLKEKIIHHAKSLGFDLIGFSPVKVQDKHVKTYKNWLLKHYEGEMFYMQKADSRLNSTKISPGAKSVIALAVNYYQPQEKLPSGCGRIARYAYGRDYHKIIKKKLKQLEKYIQQIDLKHVFQNVSAVQTRSYVDTGPLLERALAEQAGLGFIGKNSCLISREFGSWVFLSEIIVNIKLHNRNFAEQNFRFCGNCTKCIESCPTKAIIAPGIIDARKCISYLTIENKKPIPKKFTKIIKQTKRIFGCDICQEVCPHNIARQKQTIHSELTSPKIAGDQQNFKKIFSIKTDQQFLNTFAGSPLMRAKRRGLQRNTCIR